MYVLISAKEEVLSPDNKVRAFDTIYKARQAMLHELLTVAKDNGMELSMQSCLGDGALFITNEDIESDGMRVGTINGMYASLEEIHEWVIFDVPHVE